MICRYPPKDGVYEDPNCDEALSDVILKAAFETVDLLHVGKLKKKIGDLFSRAGSLFGVE